MLFTSLRVLTPPTTEPVSLDLLRAHLRLDEDFDDPVLETYLIAARDNAEKYLGRVLMPQTLQWVVSKKSDILQIRDGWGSVMSNFGNPSWPWAGTQFSEALELPRSPVTSIVSFTILDHLGNTTATQQTAAIQAAGDSTLQFSSTGFSGAAGMFLQDLSAAAAIAPGTYILGVSTPTNGIVPVTLSRPLAGPVGLGDNILFSTIQSMPAASMPASAALKLTGNSIYIADLALEPARVRPDWSGAISALNTVSMPIQHIQFVFTAGYDSVGATIPKTIIQAIMLTAAFLYERRGDEPAEAPEAIKWLLDNYRVQYF